MANGNLTIMTCIKTTESPAIMKELADVTGVAPETIASFHPSQLKVREKLRLASTRTATREDMAHSLIGIFDSDLMPKFGEGAAALGRLLQEIMVRLGEVTVLAWTAGTPSSFNSCLPVHISVYRQPPYTPPTPAEGEMETRVAHLRQAIPQAEATKIYDVVTRLPPPRFSDRRLHLPCIIFPVKKLLQLSSNARSSIYTLKASALGDIEINTTDALSLGQPGELLLVHPWIRPARSGRVGCQVEALNRFEGHAAFGLG